LFRQVEIGSFQVLEEVPGPEHWRAVDLEATPPQAASVAANAHLAYLFGSELIALQLLALGAAVPMWVALQ